MLPFLGSVPHLEKNYPKFQTHTEAFTIDNYQRFVKEQGTSIFKFGFPGIGQGVWGELHVAFDPRECLKIIQAEGKHPSGVVEVLWPIITFFRENNMTAAADQLGRGARWRRVRSITQKNLLEPSMAKSYIPAIIEAARLSSKGAQAFSDQIDQYSARCALDLFCSAFYGVFTNTTDLEGADPRDLQFCSNVLQSSVLLGELIKSPQQLILNSVGWKSTAYRKYARVFGNVVGLGAELVKEFIQKAEAGEITEAQKHSYVARTLELQKEKSADLTVQDVVDLCIVLLFAAVDTTSSRINWTLINLALNPEAQEKLHEEVRAEMERDTTKGGGGILTEEAIAQPSRLQYLQCVIRETHRLTPSVWMPLVKNLAAETELCGFTLPAGSAVAFDEQGIAKDPELVDEPFAFKPERFLPEAVKERKGTPSEIIDHPLCRGPFSAGARMCPGNRVANYELAALVAQLAYDWKIELDADYQRAHGVESYQDIGMISEISNAPINMPKFKFTPRW